MHPFITRHPPGTKTTNLQSHKTHPVVAGPRLDQKSLQDPSLHPGKRKGVRSEWHCRLVPLSLRRHRLHSQAAGLECGSSD